MTSETRSSTGGLEGFSAAVTADRRRDEQGVLLNRLGLEVFTWPLLKTSPADLSTLEALTRDVIQKPPDLLLANTGYGMRAWFKMADERELLAPLVGALRSSSVIGARGAKAVGELRRVGLEAVFRAGSETLDELVAWALDQGVEGRNVLLQLHGDPSGSIVDRLAEAGAYVRCAPIYSMGGTGPSEALDLVEAVVEGRVDVVTFTAAPQLEALAEVATAHGRLAALLRSFNDGAVVASCIGPVCAAGATDIGILAPLVPANPRLGSMASSIASCLSSRRLAWGPSADLSISGGLLTSPTAQSMLSPTVRRALRPLCAQPGVFVDLSWVVDGPQALRSLMADLSEPLGAGLEVDASRARLVGWGHPES